MKEAASETGHGNLILLHFVTLSPQFRYNDWFVHITDVKESSKKAGSKIADKGHGKLKTSIASGDNW